jgi:hypothetical protein
MLCLAVDNLGREILDDRLEIHVRAAPAQKIKQLLSESFVRRHGSFPFI